MRTFEDRVSARRLRTRSGPSGAFDQQMLGPLVTSIVPCLTALDSKLLIEGVLRNREIGFVSVARMHTAAARVSNRNSAPGSGRALGSLDVEFDFMA